MRNFLREFKDFIATGNLVEVAVAFILALAIKAVIDAFMNSVVNPLIGAIVGKPNLDNFLTITIRKDQPDEAIISFGAVLTQVIALILVGLVLFLVLKAYNKFRRVDAGPAAPTEVELLTQIRDELRARD
ncbi:MAG: large conductance mechanosensitive channel [Ilumatobacteraceae bacterium]|jgi:large conductance mechanosensitive channel